METRPMLREFKEGTSIFDKVWLSMVEPQKYILTDTVLQIKERWGVVLTLRLKARSRLFIANKLVDQYGISQGQAYEDIKNSDHFYGDVLKADQMGTRAILQEYATKAYRKAVKAKDLKAQLKAMELIGRYAGIGEDDIKQFNPAKFENKEITISAPKEVFDLIVKKLESGVIDFNQVEAEDAEFIEVE